MPADPTPGPALLSMAQQFTGLPMDSLIGGPLNAAANANSAMALTQTKFLLDTCFQAAQTGSGATAVTSYKPIMINMSLVRGVLVPATPALPAGPNNNPPAQAASPARIDQVTTAFNLPLLTIVPLNSLAVESVDVTFEMEVKSSFSDETTQSSETERKGEASFEAKLGWGPLSVTISGSASYDQKDSSTHNTHYQKSNSAKYTVNVHAGQLPLPQGVNTIIQAFTNAIQPVTMPSGPQSGGGGN